MQEIYRVKTSPVALSDNMIIGEKYRITLLTEALVRLEYSEDGVFEDRATQTVLFRDFPKAGYHVVRNADGIEVHTSMLHLIYNEKEFSSHGLSIQIKGNLSAYPVSYTHLMAHMIMSDLETIQTCLPTPESERAICLLLNMRLQEPYL